jgi:hypothetical protein
MRPEIHNPVDQHKLQQLLPLTETVFCLHEAGQQYNNELNQISRFLGRIVGQVDVLGSFGSISASEFAKRLAIDWHTVPSDLSDLELLELFDALCEARGGAVVQEYWIRCLVVNTGDDGISSLIFWPEEYFGPEYDSRELTAAEMLDVALRKRKRESN